MANEARNNNDNGGTSNSGSNRGSGISGVLEYYAKTSAGQLFRDMDDAAQFNECRQLLMNEATGNFIVDFGVEDAKCAFDLDQSHFAALLSTPRPSAITTRWINIWAPERQKDIVTTIARHYGVSARLQAMMGSDPAPPQDIKALTPRLASDRTSITVEEDEKPRVVSFNDLEHGYPQDHSQPMHVLSSHHEEADGMASFRGISFSHIVNQIWHFSSLDYGRRYVCAGYNSLYVVHGVDFGNSSSRPDGRRVWSWLMLFDDGTVVSIQENPFPQPHNFSDEQRRKALAVIRRNTSIVFSGISKQHSSSRHSNPLMTTHVRPTSSSPDATSLKPEESPSLLFYYIFDDWVANYSLVIRKEHSYSAALEKLRKNMLTQPKVELIDDLHRLGRHLATLKRIYQSYELIVSRLLKRQRYIREEARNAQKASGIVYHPNPTISGLDSQLRQETWRSISYDDFSTSINPSEQSGVELSFGAVARFERLADRIRLYALSEIEECVREKESLTFLVFNLIALKDSQAVEKLTRITILLAKATILFLPVSLMTAYFSTEIEDLQGVYTAKTYWVSFAVIFALSVVVLALFGYVSETIEGKTIYRPIGRTLYRAGRAALGNRKKKTG